MHEGISPGTKQARGIGDIYLHIERTCCRVDRVGVAHQRSDERPAGTFIQRDCRLLTGSIPLMSLLWPYAIASDYWRR